MLRDLTDLQELARSTAMDLDAPTEEAAPGLLLSTLIAADEEKTGRISLAPDTQVGGLFIENTQESPGYAPPSSAATVRDAGPPPAMEAPYARPPSDAPTRISVPPRSIPAPVPSSLGARPTQVSPEPVLAPVPVPPAPLALPAPPRSLSLPIPLWVSMIGMLVALLAGLAMGFVAGAYGSTSAPPHPSGSSLSGSSPSR
jgi:hypothetical protein